MVFKMSLSLFPFLLPASPTLSLGLLLCYMWPWRCCQQALPHPSPHTAHWCSDNHAEIGKWNSKSLKQGIKVKNIMGGKTRITWKSEKKKKKDKTVKTAVTYIGPTM